MFGKRIGSMEMCSYGENSYGNVFDSNEWNEKNSATIQTNAAVSIISEKICRVDAHWVHSNEHIRS